MNCEIENRRGDRFEQEAQRINSMLRHDCPEQACQALREDALSLTNPAAFRHLVARVNELSSQHRYGDHLLINGRGEISVEDMRGCLYGAGVDVYGYRVRQFGKICPVDREALPGTSPRWRVPRMEMQIIPIPAVPNYRDLMRNVPMPGGLPRPGHVLPLPGDFLRHLPRPGHGLPDPRDLFGGLNRPGRGLPDLREDLPGFSVPRFGADGDRRHILPILRSGRPGDLL